MTTVTIKNIDWALLRQQKEWLIEMMNVTSSDDAEGLLNLLDALQDEALNQGLSESLVFGG